jgi:hypothetical protein
MKESGTTSVFRHIYLQSSARDAWKSALSRVPFRGWKRGWGKFESAARRTAALCLPKDIKALLRGLRQPLGPAIVVIDNLPNTTPGPRPLDGKRPTTKPDLIDAVLAGVIATSGYEAFTYLQENSALHHEVAPQLGKENTPANNGRRKLPYHNDGAYFPQEFQPEVLALLGVVNEKIVPTWVLNINEDILPALEPRLLHALSQPQFTFAAPASFNFGPYEVFAMRRPIIYQANDRWQIALPSRDCKQEQRSATNALREFRELLNTLTPHSIVINEGRVAIFRNKENVHSRPNVDGERWLTRSYGASTLLPFRRAVNIATEMRAFDARAFLV